jgi:hypothetical protein
VKVKVGHKCYNHHWINSLIDYSYVTDGAGAWVANSRDFGNYDYGKCGMKVSNITLSAVFKIIKV